MPSSDRATLLSQVAPFSELQPEVLKSLAGRFEARILSEDDVLGPFSSTADNGLYLIEDGEIALVDEAGTTLEKRHQGELFGHAITIDAQRPSYRARALSNVKIAQLSAQTVSELLEQHSAFAHFLKAGPGERLRAISARPSELIAQLDLRPPVTLAPGRSIREAAQAMAQARVSSLPIVETTPEGEKLIGMLTDRDLRSRVLAKGLDPTNPLEQVMTPQPVSVKSDGRIDDALMEMMKLGVHHLPVLNDQNQLCGVVSAGDLMRVQAPHPLRLVRDIQRADSDAAVAALAQQSAGMLSRLVHAGTEVSDVGRMASMITDACTKALIQSALQALGDAPMAWCWAAFGSQARMEQGLISDQDNGLILEREPDDAEAHYFKAFADHICDGLNACGYIYCPGGVMAKGEWRMSWKQWRKTFHAWMTEPEPKAVMKSSIFFDMRAVAGDLELADSLHAEVLEQARHSTLFRRFLAAESMGNRPALGLFGQFAREDGEDQARGLNLKKRGVIPIVDLARVRALEGAISLVHTEERIQAAAEASVMNSADADDLIHALRFIGNTRLRHQVALFDAGKKPDHLVDPDELSGLHRRYLRSAFGIVKTAQKALEQRYSV